MPTPKTDDDALEAFERKREEFRALIRDGSVPFETRRELYAALCREPRMSPEQERAIYLDFIQLAEPSPEQGRELFLALLARQHLTIPQTIRLMRQTTGMTIPEYAKHVGVSTRYLGDIERGLMNPTIEILEKITVPFRLVVKLVPAEGAG